MNSGTPPDRPDVIGDPVGHISTFLKLSAPKVTTGRDDWLIRSSDWLFLWRRWDYPGRIAGFLSVLPPGLSWNTAKGWLSGRRRPPAWALEAVGDALEARIREGQEILAGVREAAKQASERPRRGNFVDSETGRSKRGHWRR